MSSTHEVAGLGEIFSSYLGFGLQTHNHCLVQASVYENLRRPVTAEFFFEVARVEHNSLVDTTRHLAKTRVGSTIPAIELPHQWVHDPELDIAGAVMLSRAALHQLRRIAQAAQARERSDHDEFVGRSIRRRSVQHAVVSRAETVLNCGDSVLVIEGAMKRLTSRLTRRLAHPPRVGSR